MSEINWWDYCTTKMACDGSEKSLFFVRLDDDNKKLFVKKIPDDLYLNRVGPEELFPYKIVCYKCYCQLVENLTEQV